MAASILAKFADVTPVPQDDGDRPVVPIAYTEEFSLAHDYFRAVLARDELSERTLALTEAIIELNAANYTAWHFRRRCLRALKKEWAPELEYVTEVTQENPKNYQVWYHRRCVVEGLGDSSGELKFTRAVLAMDAKNYHAWSHRQWVLQHFGGWETELDFVNELLSEDVRNNSAWNHRWFVIENTTKLTDEVRAREVALALEKLQEAVHNESPWNYLRGLLIGQDLCKYGDMRVLLNSLAVEGTKSPPLLGMLVDFAVAFGELPLANELCVELETKQDTMRKRYWQYRRAQINTITAASAETAPEETPEEVVEPALGAGASGDARVATADAVGASTAAAAAVGAGAGASGSGAAAAGAGAEAAATAAPPAPEAVAPPPPQT